MLDDSSWVGCLAQLLLLVQIKTHTRSSCSSLFSSFHFTKLWLMTGWYPESLLVRWNKIRVQIGCHTYWAILAGLLKSNKKISIHGEHTRRNSPAAPQSSCCYKGSLALGQTGPDVTTLQRTIQGSSPSVFKDLPQRSHHGTEPEKFDNK